MKLHSEISWKWNFTLRSIGCEASLWDKLEIKFYSKVNAMWSFTLKSVGCEVSLWGQRNMKFLQKSMEFEIALWDQREMNFHSEISWLRSSSLTPRNISSFILKQEDACIFNLKSMICEISLWDQMIFETTLNQRMH